MQALESESRPVLGQWEFARLPEIPEFPLAKGCKLIHFKDEQELDVFAKTGLNVVDLKTPRSIIGPGKPIRNITRVRMALVYDPKIIDVATRPIGKCDVSFTEARELRQEGYAIVYSDPSSLVVGWKQKDPIGTP